MHFLFSRISFILANCLFVTRILGIQIIAPKQCGGSRIVTHAAAKFGASLTATASPLPIYVPRRKGSSSADPDFLCIPPSPSKNSKNSNEDAHGRVMLVLRGGCEFAKKVRIAQNMGAAGIIIINGHRDNALVTMKLNDTAIDDITIPSVMIRFAEWKKISRCVLSPETMMPSTKQQETASITGITSSDVQVRLTRKGQAVYDVEYGRDALNWAMVRGVILWVLCQWGISIVRYRRRISESRRRADAITNVLPSHKFGTRPAEMEDDDEVCAICLEPMRLNENVVSLPNCTHTYHDTCIYTWLERSSNVCPVCKRTVEGLPAITPEASYGSTVNV